MCALVNSSCAVTPLKNALLLLALNNIRRNGIGNEREHIGRYIMEHIWIFVSHFVPASFLASAYARNKRSNVILGLANVVLSKTIHCIIIAGSIPYLFIASLGRTRELSKTASCSRDI